MVHYWNEDFLSVRCQTVMREMVRVLLRGPASGHLERDPEMFSRVRRGRKVGCSLLI